jgi:hypothetical protein
VTWLFVLSGIVVGVLKQPPLAVDDAAISFRYAARIAAGLGFTYSEGERVLGTSSPLYVLSLAILHGRGADIEDAARAIGIISFAAAAGLVFAITRRLSGLQVLSGLFAAWRW